MATPLLWQFPPTVCSGYGCLSEEDVSKSPMTILREHESTLQQWVLTLSPFHLAPHLKVATRHQLFNKYMSQVQGRKLEDFKDLIEFDLWLKKLEISEQGIGSPALAETSPESVETVKVVKTPKPAEPVKPERERKEPPKECPLLELTPQQKAAYKDYWSKYGHSGSPSASPASITTPEVRKKLDLAGPIMTVLQSGGWRNLFLLFFVIIPNVDPSSSI